MMCMNIDSSWLGSLMLLLLLLLLLLMLQYMGVPSTEADAEEACAAASSVSE